MTERIKRLIDNGNIRTMGVAATFLGVIVSLIIQVTSGTTQQIRDLKEDFGNQKTEMKVIAKDQANTSLRVAVLETQYDNIQKTMDRIENKLEGPGDKVR